jgi:hypothetical protein
LIPVIDAAPIRNTMISVNAACDLFAALLS